jgi:NTP pyrophosphatase (non-canonical NTP hydrolase)
VKRKATKDKDLGDELADVLFVLTCLANQTGIDLEDAMHKKSYLRRSNRDAKRHKNNPKLS